MATESCTVSKWVLHILLKCFLVLKNCILYLSNLTDQADLLIVNNLIIYSHKPLQCVRQQSLSLIANTQFMIISSTVMILEKEVFRLIGGGGSSTFCNSNFLSLSGFNLKSVLPNDHLLLFKSSNL